LGAILFIIVALSHVFEALQVLPMFGWGQPDSVGHYVDLFAAALGAVVVVWGVLLLYFQASLSRRRSGHRDAPSNNRWRGP